jgi:predicted CXXCH cytochrome family protein
MPPAAAASRRFTVAAFATAVCLTSVLSSRDARAQAAPAPAADSCVGCHATQQEARVAAPARLFSQTDIHRQNGFGCVDCHGGDGSATDKSRAHAVARDFKGKPRGQQLIETCARCHADGAFMRRYNPRQRVDQAAEYATSIHGQRLAQGDEKVATCASCHAAHGIRRVSDAKSPVFRTNVASTCASCHADPRHMAGYTVAGGTPLSTNQFADYQKSVHYRALTKANDLTAPTCNDCHGNHGAAPPGVGAIVNVCGTCHAVFAEKFATSVHKEIFEKGCVECHGNHAITQPSDEMLGARSPGICGPCHSPEDKGDKGTAAAGTMRSEIEGLKAGIETSRALVTRVKDAGIEVGDAELALREAGTKLTLARTEVHAFEPSRIAPIVADGMTLVAQVNRAGDQGVAELQYRRRGLAASLVAILLVVVALIFKIRQIDRRGAGRIQTPKG